MSIRDIMTQEARDLRAKGAQILADAQTEVQKLEAKAQSIEAGMAGIPAELEALEHEAASRVVSWFKSL